MNNFFTAKTSILKRIIFLITASALLLFASGCMFFETPPVESQIVISQTEAEIDVGETVTLTAATSLDKPIVWTCTDESIATVNDGVVTGIEEGETTVIASDGVKVAVCVIKVNAVVIPAPATVTISKSYVEIKAGESVTLTASSSDGAAISWTSENTSVATVKDGVVTGVDAGSTVITASNGTDSKTCAINVLSADGKRLIWDDEFDGNSLDMTKWSYQVGTQDKYGSSNGPQYWGNDELQYYTEGDNLKVAGGSLQITAKRERKGDRDYTSSRIVTRDKASFTFGYIEAKMKLPTGEGMWPAFWMLPQPPSKENSNNIYGGWARNGEIDIMEAKGRLINKIDTTIHFGDYWPDNKYLSKTTTLSSNIDEWHTYAVDWRADYIAWIIDGKEVYRVRSDRWWTSASDKASAPFDQPFFILLNLAVGGQYDGYRSPSADFTSATMYVDYVRVYS